MIDKIKNLLVEKKDFILNIFYTLFIQIFSLTSSFYLYYYFVNTLSEKHLGIFAFGFSITQFYATIIAFGFGVTAVVSVGKVRNDKKKISSLLSTVLFSKLLVFFIALPIYILYCYLYQNEYFIFYLICLLFCSEELFIPYYLFQALEKMKLVSLISFISKIIYVVLSIIFVKSNDLIFLIPIFFFVGSLLSFITSFYLLKSMKLTYEKTNKSNVLFELKESSSIFVSQIFTVVKLKTNLFLVDTYSGGKVQVANYDFAERIYGILRIPFEVVNKVLFPNVLKNKNYSFVLRLMMISLILALFVYTLIYLFNESLIALIDTERKLSTAHLILKIFILQLIFYAFNSFSMSIMIPSGNKKFYNLVVRVSSIVFILASLIFVMFGFKQVDFFVMSLILSEFSYFIMVIYFIVKHKILFK